MIKPLIPGVANVTVQHGKTAQLVCRVGSDAVPYIRFVKTINGTEYEVIKIKEFKNRTNINVISPESKTGFYEHSLWIDNVTFADEGKYTCKAGNSIGITREVMYLRVVPESKY